MVNDRERDIFDAILDKQVDALPPRYAAWLEEVPLIVEDEPDDALLIDLGMEPGEDLYGLHTGTPLTERSVDAGVELPDHIQLFRGPIMRLAGWSFRTKEKGDRRELTEQVRITLLHELGHHFGLDEDDLDELGYA